VRQGKLSLRKAAPVLWITRETTEAQAWFRCCKNSLEKRCFGDFQALRYKGPEDMVKTQPWEGKGCDQGHTGAWSRIKATPAPRMCSSGIHRRDRSGMRETAHLMF
jgi:hypothetical protein